MLVVYPMHWIDPLISFFRRSVCVFVNRSVVERLRPQFLTDFHEICMRLRNVVASSAIVLRFEFDYVLRPQLFTDFHQILQAARECVRFDTCCL